ncbi:major facilitator superfamily domain-containing protein [Diaporthe sp. PMI_573]|nr:major facilitator superfamily domain-containing protein [Diaporthaceae sp. PMI_573]
MYIVLPLGILEDHKLEHVPGTAPLSEVGRSDLAVETNGLDCALLKHDPTGQIVLVPQPSDSPNDPYNWPRWKKELFTLNIIFGYGCVGAVGPLLTPAFVPLAEQFGVPLMRFTYGTNGSCLAAIAAGSLLFNTLAVKIGKRPIYLATTLGLAVCCFWAAEVRSFGSLIGAPHFEALIPASVADMWHVYERGMRMAIFNLGVLGGINLAGLIGEYTVSGIRTVLTIFRWGRDQQRSYRIAMHAMGGAFVLMLLQNFFFMPESAFRRTNVLNIDTGGKVVEIEKTGVEQIKESQNVREVSDARISYTRELLPWSGFWDRVSFWRTFIRPFFMLASPVVQWATLMFTICISWLVLILITLSQIFSAPPYNFSISSVGATNVSAFVASIIATFAADYVVDGIAKFMSIKNKGIFGQFAWGESLYEQDPWPIPVIVCLGLINLGV